MPLPPPRDEVAATKTKINRIEAELPRCCVTGKTNNYGEDKPKGHRGLQSIRFVSNLDSRISPMPIGHDVSAAVAMFKRDRTAIEHDALSTVRDLGICDTLMMSQIETGR